MINNLIKLPGGVGDQTPTNQIDPIQLSTGVQIEMEHTNDLDIAKEIAMDHLTEDPKYYSKLVAAGLASEFKPGAGTGFGDPTTSLNDPARIGVGGLKKGNMHGKIGNAPDGEVDGRRSDPVVNKTIDVELEEQVFSSLEEALLDEKKRRKKGKGKRKPKPTNPVLWARAKSAARSKFDVYPSAYANGWAAKWYKSKGGGWRMSEGIDVNKFMPGSPPMFGSIGLPDSNQISNDIKKISTGLKDKLINGAKELKRIFSEERDETKEMLSILHKIHNNLEVTPEQKKKATQQFFDLLKLVGLAGIFKMTFKIPFSSEAIYGVSHLLNKYVGIQILPSSMMSNKVKKESYPAQAMESPFPADATMTGSGTSGSGYDFVGYAESKQTMNKQQLKEAIKRMIREMEQDDVNVDAEKETVTITLDRELAQKLHSLLMTQLTPPGEDAAQTPAGPEDANAVVPAEDDVEAKADDMSSDQLPIKADGESGESVDDVTSDESDSMDEAKKQWIQKAISKPGALKKALHVPDGEKIPAKKLAAAAKKGGKMGQRARLAKTLRKLKESLE